MAATLVSKDPHVAAKLQMQIVQANVDLIRLSVADLNGQPRGKTIPARNVRKFLTKGLGIYAGTVGLGPRSKIIVFMDEVLEMNHANCAAMPDPESFRLLPWAGAGHYKVGELQCETYWDKDLTPQQACPRYVARQQLSRLEGLGYSLYSTWEQEFQLFTNGPAQEPVFSGRDMYSNFILEKNGGILFDLDKMLLGAGINVETFETEYAAGQFEVTLEPCFGITAADNSFIFRQAVRELADKRDLEAIFMSKPLPDFNGNGAHFNHSLWDKNMGTNVFHDSESTDGLSDVARHWLGGLLEHSAALTALCSPTVNCYRRIHKPWAPDTAHWGIDDREALIRVKVGAAKETYMENRVCSGLCNPYLALAATVAAGIDGINSKIEPQPAGQKESSPKLPFSFSEALDALEQDEVIVNGLGSEFVKWFLKVKRGTDMFLLKDSDPAVPDEKAIAAERDLYKLC